MNQKLSDFFFFGITDTKVDNKEIDLNQKSKPLINGREVSINYAIDKLIDILQKENLVHFDGLACDQKSINSVLSFAEKKRLSVNHCESNEINNFYDAFQRYGASLVSFNELRNRCDLLLFIGNFEREILIRFNKKIYWDEKRKKSIFFFSEKLFSIFNKEFKLKKLFDFIPYFSCLSSKKKENKFSDMYEKFRKSKYPVLVFNPNNDFIFIQQIFRILEKLNNNNKKIRLFKLSGLNNSSGFVNSCITKTGFPGFLKFTDWGVDYNPLKNNSTFQKKNLTTQFIFSNLNKSPLVVDFKKNIFIGHPNTKYQKKYDVYIPVKTPGIDVDGIVVRSDGAATMKLKKKIESDYIEICELMKRISVK